VSEGDIVHPEDVLTDHADQSEDEEKKIKDERRKNRVDKVYKLLLKHYPDWAMLYYKVGRIENGVLYFSTTYIKDLFEFAIHKLGWKEKLLEVLKPLGIEDIVVEEKGLSAPYVPSSEEEALKVIEQYFPPGGEQR